MIYLVVCRMDILGVFNYENVHEGHLVAVGKNWHIVNSKSMAVSESGDPIAVLKVSGALRRTDSENAELGFTRP